MPERERRFAWCFSHGRLHTFWTGESPWCTAIWVWLDGVSEADAMKAKTGSYGDAQFLDQLPSAASQLAVMDQARRDQA